MSLKIENISSISKGVRKVLYEQCNEAGSILSENGKESPHETIHEVRKIFKKIRGVLRLVRDTTDQYQDENKFFRDEARKISDLRDTTSLIEAIDLLYSQYSDKLYKNAFSSIRTKLENNRKEQEMVLIDKQNILQEIYSNLESKCEKLLNLPLDIDSFQLVITGIRRTYKRGRKAMKKASGSEAPEDFHEWRKRVKYLRYQLRAIQPVWPGIWDAWEDELHELSDSLGTDRDLFMLQNFIEKWDNEHQGDNMTEKDRHLLRSLIEGHRHQLQDHAVLLGKKLYQLAPANFAAVIEAAWSAQLSIDQSPLIDPEALEK